MLQFDCAIKSYLLFYNKVLGGVFAKASDTDPGVQHDAAGLFEDFGIAQILSQDLQVRHVKLLTYADAVLDSADFQAAQQSFGVFAEEFQVFLTDLSGFYELQMAKNNAKDAVTGFRSINTLEHDIKLELARHDRDGGNLSLVLLKVKGFEELQATMDQEALNRLLRKISKMVADSLRIYDEAYWCGDGSFVLFLKKTESKGGVRASERLRHAFDDDPALASKLAYCVSEPNPGDNIKELLQYLHQNVDSSSERGVNIVEYEELSPLQRFVEGEHQSSE